MNNPTNSKTNFNMCKRWLFLMNILLIMALASCAKNHCQEIQNSTIGTLITPHRCFKQDSATKNNPPKFYTCDQVKKWCGK